MLVCGACVMLCLCSVFFCFDMSCYGLFRLCLLRFDIGVLCSFCFVVRVLFSVDVCCFVVVMRCCCVVLWFVLLCCVLLLYVLYVVFVLVCMCVDVLCLDVSLLCVLC